MYIFYNDTSEHNPRMNNREGGWRWGEGGSVTKNHYKAS